MATDEGDSRREEQKRILALKSVQANKEAADSLNRVSKSIGELKETTEKSLSVRADITKKATDKIKDYVKDIVGSVPFLGDGILAVQDSIATSWDANRKAAAEQLELEKQAKIEQLEAIKEAAEKELASREELTRDAQRAFDNKSKNDKRTFDDFLQDQIKINLRREQKEKEDADRLKETLERWDESAQLAAENINSLTERVNTPQDPNNFGGGDDYTEIRPARLQPTADFSDVGQSSMCCEEISDSINDLSDNIIDTVEEKSEEDTELLEEIKDAVILNDENANLNNEGVIDTLSESNTNVTDQLTDLGGTVVKNGKSMIGFLTAPFKIFGGFLKSIVTKLTFMTMMAVGQFLATVIPLMAIAAGIAGLVGLVESFNQEFGPRITDAISSGMSHIDDLRIAFQEQFNKLYDGIIRSWEDAKNFFKELMLDFKEFFAKLPIFGDEEQLKEIQKERSQFDKNKEMLDEGRQKEDTARTDYYNDQRQTNAITRGESIGPGTSAASVTTVNNSSNSTMTNPPLDAKRIKGTSKEGHSSFTSAFGG